jgi:heterodisulfide reductase subunit A-like polyferredoxin
MKMGLTAATLGIYSIKDNQTPAFIQMFFAQSDAAATRVCATLLRDDTQLSMFAEHFDLYKCGEIDQNIGVITPEKMPQFICGMVTLKTLQEANHGANQARPAQN